MRRMMREFGFLLFGIVYYLSLLTIAITAVGRLAGHEDLALANAGGIGMLLNVTSILVWGLIAGTMTYRRGWNIGGKNDWEITRWLSLTVVEGLFAFGTIAMAARSYGKHGKFFPAPNEC